MFTNLNGIANLEYVIPEDTKKDNKVIITATLYNSDKSTIQELVNEIRLVNLEQFLIENGPWIQYGYESTSSWRHDNILTFKEGGILETSSIWVDLDETDGINYAKTRSSSVNWGVDNDKVIMWFMVEGEAVYAYLSSVSEKAITVVECCDVFNECRDCGEDDISTDTYVSTKNK